MAITELIKEYEKILTPQELLTEIVSPYRELEHFLEIDDNGEKINEITCYAFDKTKLEWLKTQFEEIQFFYTHFGHKSGRIKISWCEHKLIDMLYCCLRIFETGIEFNL